MFIFSRNRNPVQKAVKAILVDVRTGKTHVRLGWSERFSPARSLEISFGDFAEPKKIQRFLGEMAFPYPNGKGEIEFIRELKAVANAYRAEGKRVHFVTDEVGWNLDLSCFVLPTETLGDESGPVFSMPGLEHVAKVSKGGDFDRWKKEVALPALASSRFVLAISAALAASIIRLLRDAPPAFGVNFSGESSSVTGLVVSIPREPILPPGSCFCPQSARGRCLMGSDEDWSTNLRTRSRRPAAPGFAV